MGELLSAAELEAMIEDTDGVPVELGVDDTWGHFEIVDELVLSPTEVIVDAPTLVIPTGVLSDLVEDAELTVERDGEEETWVVRYFEKIDDGALTRIVLKKA